MKLYKLSNGTLVNAPVNLEVNGQLHSPVSGNVLIEQGYKPLKQAEMQPIEWYEKHVITYIETENQIIENVTISPIDNLKTNYLQRLNNDCDNAIISGFVFTDSDGVVHPVWLSMENQLNYSQVDIPCELKLGLEDWVDLTVQSELTRFKNEIKAFIQTTLKACWVFKKAINGMDDQQVYNYLKNL